MGIRVCKFGGSSVADAGQMRKVRAIVDAEDERRFVVPSAPGKRSPDDIKITDMLYRTDAAAAAGEPIDPLFDQIAERYRKIVADLGLDSLAVIFNGAAVYCPREDRLLEERLLSNRTVNAALDYAQAQDVMTVVMQADHKFVREPKSDAEAAALEGLHGVQLVPQTELPRERAIRITFLTNRLPTARELADEVEHARRRPRQQLLVLLQRANRLRY